MIDVYAIDGRIYVMADNIWLGLVTEWTSKQLEDGLHKITISTPTSQNIYFVSKDNVVIHKNETGIMPCDMPWSNFLFDPYWRKITL